MGPGVAEDVATMGSQFGVQLCLLGHCRAQWSTVLRLTELRVAHVFSQVQSAVVSWTNTSQIQIGDGFKAQSCPASGSSFGP